MQLTPVDNEIRRLSDLADENRSYNLVEAYQQRIAIEEMDKIIKRYQEVRNKIAEQYARTIGEYLEGEITQSDGIIIKKVKDGRATFLEEEARKLYPNECNAAQTSQKIFNIERFKEANPVSYDKYCDDSFNLTLTDLRNKKQLTEEQLEKCIKRGPATYEVEVLQKDPANIPLIEE